MIFSFGDYELDDERFELRCQERQVHLQPKALELLLHLLRNRGRVVARQEILAAVWPETAVTEGSLARAVSLARESIGDRGERPSAIVTVARRGYRFAAPVSERSGADAAKAEDPSARYVGRAALRARLEARLDGALAGAGRILFLAGEAGIGKTRTAELLAARARQAGVRVATAWRCEESDTALSSWARLLRSIGPDANAVAATLRPLQRAALARLVPELGGAVADANEAPLGEDVERFALFDAVQSVLLGVAASTPLALFLDDLHCADADSIVLLELVAQAIASQRIAIVATCREEDATRTPRRARALERLLRVTSLERWQLTGLGSDEVHEFVRARLGGEVDESLSEALERQTGGNPLLMGEGLRSLEARGALGVPRDVQGWASLLPRGIRHLLLPKLGALSAGAIEALGVAAAIGMEVELPLLERCVAAPAGLQTQLGEVFDASLLRPGAAVGRAPRFSHNLVRDALYEELVPAGNSRRAVHARVSRALEQSVGDWEEALAERAHHALEAVPLVPATSAVDLAHRAGQQAVRQLDFERAVAWYERALAKLPGAELALRAELLLGLSHAQTRAFGLERARASYREAADHARALGRHDLFARAALGFAHRPSSSGRGDAESIALLEEARQRVPSGDEALRARLLSRLAVELRYDDRPRAERVVAEAVRDARRLGDPVALAQALDDSSFVRWSPVDPEGWVALNAEVVEVAEACGDLELAFSGQRGVATGFLELGDRAAVERQARASSRAAHGLNLPYGRWFCAAQRALLALRDGELALAERHALEALATSELIESPEVALEAGGQLVYLRMEQGRGHEIVAVVRSQLERFPEMRVWRAALARILVSSGLEAEARLELDRLGEHRFSDVPRDRGYLATLAMAAEVAHATENVAAAAALEPLLAPHARLHVVAGTGLIYYGSVAHALGVAAATGSRWDAAVAHFEAALAAEEDAGARLWAARTRVECARALLARGADGDRRRAAKLVRAGLGSARQHDWAEVVTQGRDLETALSRERARPAGALTLGSDG